MVSMSVSQALFCDTCRVAQKVQKLGITNSNLILTIVQQDNLM